MINESANESIKLFIHTTEEYFLFIVSYFVKTKNKTSKNKMNVKIIMCLEKEISPE